MYRDVSQFKNKILQEHKLVKDINFSEDIDQDKSDKYRIDKNNRFLEFLFAENTLIEYSDFSAVIGNVESCNDQIMIKPVLFNTTSYPGTMKQAQVLIDKCIDRNINNLLQIEFENKSYDDRLYFKLSNVKHYKRLKAVVRGDIEYTRQLFNNSGSRSLSFIYDKGVFLIVYQEDTTLNTVEYKQIDFERTISLFIDLEKEYLTVNGNKLHYSNSPISADDKCYLSIALLAENNKEDQNRLKMGKIVYGCREGYVYLKPIKLMGKMSKVFVVHKGMLHMQYQDKDNNWIDVDDNTGGISAEELIIRIGMNIYDRIYEIIIVEDNNC